MAWQYDTSIATHVHRLRDADGRIAWGVEAGIREVGGEAGGNGVSGEAADSAQGSSLPAGSSPLVVDADSEGVCGTETVALPAGERPLLVVKPLPGGLVVDVVRTFHGLTEAEVHTLVRGCFDELSHAAEATERIGLECFGLTEAGRPRLIPGLRRALVTSVPRAVGELVYHAVHGRAWSESLLPVGIALESTSGELRELVTGLLDDERDPGVLPEIIAEVTPQLSRLPAPVPLPLVPASRDLDPALALTARLRAIAPRETAADESGKRRRERTSGTRRTLPTSTTAVGVHPGDQAHRDGDAWRTGPAEKPLGSPQPAASTGPRENADSPPPTNPTAALRAAATARAGAASRGATRLLPGPASRNTSPSAGRSASSVTTPGRSDPPRGHGSDARKPRRRRTSGRHRAGSERRSGLRLPWGRVGSRGTSTPGTSSAVSGRSVSERPVSGRSMSGRPVRGRSVRGGWMSAGSAVSTARAWFAQNLDRRLGARVGLGAAMVVVLIGGLLITRAWSTAQHAEPVGAATEMPAPASSDETAMDEGDPAAPPDPDPAAPSNPGPSQPATALTDAEAADRLTQLCTQRAEALAAGDATALAALTVPGSSAADADEAIDLGAYSSATYAITVDDIDVQTNTDTEIVLSAKMSTSARSAGEEETFDARAVVFTLGRDESEWKIAEVTVG